MSQLELAGGEAPIMPQPRARKVVEHELTLVQADRVRQAMGLLLNRRFGGNMSELARALGRSQPAVSAIVYGHNQASMKTAERVANLFGLRHALDLVDSKMPIAELDADANRSPTLVSALRRLEGLLAPEVMRRLRRMRLQHSDERSELEWIELAVDWQRQHQAGTLGKSNLTTAELLHLVERAR